MHRCRRAHSHGAPTDTSNGWVIVSVHPCACFGDQCRLLCRAADRIDQITRGDPSQTASQLQTRPGQLQADSPYRQPGLMQGPGASPGTPSKPAASPVGGTPSRMGMSPSQFTTIRTSQGLVHLETDLTDRVAIQTSKGEVLMRREPVTPTHPSPAPRRPRSLFEPARNSDPAVADAELKALAAELRCVLAPLPTERTHSEGAQCLSFLRTASSWSDCAGRMRRSTPSSAVSGDHRTSVQPECCCSEHVLTPSIQPRFRLDDWDLSHSPEKGLAEATARS